MTRGKDPPHLPYTYTPSSSSPSYYICNIMRDLNLWFSKCSEKKIFLWQPRYYDWLKKMIIKFTFLKYSFFENVLLLTVSLKKFSSNIIFRWYGFRKFHNVKFNYFSERHNNKKERFRNIFDWPLCWWCWK